MTEEQQPPRVTAEELLAEAEGTSLGDLLRDDQRRRHLLATMMAEHPDPILREIGQQWRDGVATPRQLLSVPEYWAALRPGYDALKEIDLGETDLGEIAEQADEQRRREREGHQ
jgi:hypothetical protein